MASELVEVIGNKVKLNLHPGQTKAWDSERRFTFIYAGTQGGKTAFEPWWLRREINNKGAGDYLAVTATYDLFKLKFLPEMQHVFCDLFDWQYAASERVIWKRRKPRLFDRIIMRSAESEGGLESATAKAAILDECGLEGFSLRAWEAIQRRLSLNQGRVLGGTTLYNLGWTKTEVYDRWRKGDTDYMVINFPSIINPQFPQQEYERAKRTLPTWKFNMMYMGEFSRPPGLIYSDLTEDHYIKPFRLKPEWPRYVAIDPGPNNTAAVWIAEDPKKNVFYLYREYLDGDKTTHEHVKSVTGLSKNENVFKWALGQKSEKQYRLDWQAEGVPVVEPSISEVDPGIDRVIALIKEKRLYIFDNLPGCKDQFGTYSREVDDNGQVTEKIKDKEKFHFMDALRYDVIAITSDTWLIS